MSTHNQIDTAAAGHAGAGGPEISLFRYKDEWERKDTATPAPPPEGTPRTSPARYAGEYEEIGAEIGRLVDVKNRAHGDSFHRCGAIMQILYPVGIKPEQMDDALAIVRIVDEFFRLGNKRDTFGEDPWENITGYGILKCRKQPEQGGPIEGQP